MNEMSKEELREANRLVIEKELGEATDAAEYLSYKMSDIPWLIEQGEYVIVLAMVKNRATHCKFGGNWNRSKRSAYLLKLRGLTDNLMAHIKATEWADRYIYQDELKMTRALLYDRDRSN